MARHEVGRVDQMDRNVDPVADPVDREVPDQDPGQDPGQDKNRLTGPRFFNGSRRMFSRGLPPSGSGSSPTLNGFAILRRARA